MGWEGLAWCEAQPHAIALDSCFALGTVVGDRDAVEGDCEALGGFLGAPHTQEAYEQVLSGLSGPIGDSAGVRSSLFSLIRGKQACPAGLGEPTPAGQ